MQLFMNKGEKMTSHLNITDTYIDTSDIERIFLAQFLNANEAIKIDIIKKIKPEYFLNDTYREVFKYFRAWCLKESDETLSKYLFIKEQKSKYGRLYAELNSEFMTSANYEYYLKQIISKYKEAKEKEIKELLYKGIIPFPEATQKMNELKNILETEEKTDIVNDIFEEYWKGVDCIETGWTSLDSMTGGLHNGELIILAGAPSMGKSVTMLNIAENVARKGKETLIVSLEMKRNALLNRLTCAKAEINASKFRSRTLTDAEEEKYVKALKNEVLTLPLHIVDKPNMTIQDIKTEAINLQKTAGLDFLVIDYLGLIKPLKPMNSKYLEITELTRDLKILAGELNIPVMVLCQLNRTNADRKDKRPQLFDLRDSGSIEQDADIVMFVYREEYYEPTTTNTGKITISIKKHRDGTLGEATLNFNKAQQKISEPKAFLNVV